MRRGFFARLAVTNIRKNKSVYVPYIITCISSVAMLYMMLFINQNKGISALPHSGDVKMITSMGITVIGIFSFIFLLYSNSFLMKRRQKELGLYNILGMEKGHISKMLFLETVITALISFVGGIAAGILGSKLALLLLLKLMHMKVLFGFEIPLAAIRSCALFCGAVFLLILVNNMRKVRFSQPIELLRGGNQGEKEPKAKWLMALIGFVCLGSGYYIAITTESPLTALFLFFLAVLLVMAGTYLVFTAGSIVILKIMRRKKSFYYKLQNFTSVSGMMYRMKQNAVGLASICILSTGVLLMISTTVCLNSGIDGMMKEMHPRELTLDFWEIEDVEGNVLGNIREKLFAELENQKIPYENVVTMQEFSAACLISGDDISFQEPEGIGAVTDAVNYLTVISAEEYEYQTGEKPGLSDGELFAVKDGKHKGEALTIQGETYRVKEWLEEDFAKETRVVSTAAMSMTVVVSDGDYEKLFREQREVYGEYANSEAMEFYLDFKGSAEEEMSYAHQVNELADSIMKENGNEQKAYYRSYIRQEQYDSYYSLFGGLLFIGIFLGALFLLGTAMIIYYKQISEGYEDKERFEIMQKVGMSRKEVRSSIKRQVLMVFFLPLLMAALHIAMAFPMIKRLLMLFGLNNELLFAVCTLVTLGIFSLIYAGIYALTAKSYYKIVERR